MQQQQTVKEMSEAERMAQTWEEESKSVLRKIAGTQ